MTAHVPFPMSEPLGPPVSPYHFGVIGNMHAAALVSRHGSIDWACLPRFDSPSVFGALLDPGRGGSFGLSLTGAAGVGRQRYLPSTNVLETRFDLADRKALVVTDFMPVLPGLPIDEQAVILRVIDARGGRIPVTLRCGPRFQYGQYRARWVPGTDHWKAFHGSDALWLSGPRIEEGPRGTAELHLLPAPGHPETVAVGWGESPSIDTTNPRLLSQTRHYWRKWVHSPGAPILRVTDGWHRWVERSELLLKLLSNGTTGAFIAAPTTSLPEWPGGTRNWDYRYVWIRDAAFSAQALALSGHANEARSFLRWVVGRVDASALAPRLQVVYGAHGEADLHERTLDHLVGFGGARPVRVGNDAARQFQLDIYGEVLDAALLLADSDSGALDGQWEALGRLADYVAGSWRLPDHGIWEIRGAPAHYIHSKVMAWVALDRAARLAERFGSREERSRYDRVAQEVRTWILADGLDRRGRGFVQAVGRPYPDAANLRIPLVGFLPVDDTNVEATFRWVERELASDPFVYRYRHPDGIAEPEGSFLLAAFWRIEYLARRGRRHEALRSWQALLAAASPLGLFAEEYDPRSRYPLGNFPQAFSHIGLLRAAVALGLSKGRQSGPIAASFGKPARTAS